MNPSSTQHCVAHLTCVTTRSDLIPELSCWGCQGMLDRHQPNPGQPFQFLATCLECGLWYRIQVLPGDEMAAVFQLPEIEELEAEEPEPGPVR